MKMSRSRRLLIRFLCAFLAVYLSFGAAMASAHDVYGSGQFYEDPP